MVIKEKLERLKASIKPRYRNGQDQIGRDLVSPCLELAKLYRRGTGFFSSSAMLAYVGSLDKLIHDQIKIQILCSPVVHDKVVLETIKFNKDPNSRQKTLHKFADNIVLIAAGFRTESSSQGRRYRQQLLSYLIAKGTIEIKFALPRNFTDEDFEELVKVSEQAKDLQETDEEELEQAELTKNLYHVKNGYFLLEDGEQVVFDGSFNESLSGHRAHIDSTNVWRSWIPEDKARLNILRSEIDADFDDTSPYFKVVPLGEEALRIITEGAPSIRPRKAEHPQNPPPEQPKTPPTPDSLRYYQVEALNAWKLNSCTGIIALATGTGKTKTAITAIKAFREQAKNGLVVVTVPYQPLAFQWISELRAAGITTISIFDNKNDWLTSATNFIDAHLDGKGDTKRTPVFVCVNASFKGEEFQNQLQRLTGNSLKRLIIVDECHHFNNKEALRFLPGAFQFRLGLSATPYEEDEQRSLDNYFGGIVFEYTIKQAILDGHLCPYNYYPILIEFSQEELKEVIGISRRIEGSQDHISEYEKLDKALETAAQKLLALEKVISEVKPEDRDFSLFYCGRGSITLPDGSEVRQVSTVTGLLNRMKWSVGRITYLESQAEREGIFHAFKNAQINALASIRVLDEGIDIPNCRNAFVLASQRSERQGIQRRGRVLRNAEGKKYANLYDFIVIGPRSDQRFLENLYEKELRRARLFSKDAANSAYCDNILNSIG